MIVTLDGQRLDEPHTADGTLQELVDHVRDSHARERLIVSVSVNGTRLGDAELDAHLPQAIPGDAQVDLETGDRIVLVRDALRGLAAEFDEATGRHAEVADRLAAGEIESAMRDVAGLLEVWQTCQRALAQCGGLLGEDLTQRTYDGRPVNAHLEDVIGRLGELRQALQDNDAVLLGDLFRYELPPLCETWGRLLASVAEEVGAEASGA